MIQRIHRIVCSHNSIEIMIQKIYRITCAHCQYSNEIHNERNKMRATKAFRGIGWGVRKGKWYCQTCLGGGRI